MIKNMDKLAYNQKKVKTKEGENVEFEEIINFLEEHGDENTRRIYSTHGIPDPKFGVKVSELKKIQKKVKKNYELSMKLFETGNYDAMYLAGLIADEKKMSIEDLKHWLQNSKSSHIASSTVAWIAAESQYGIALAQEWILAEDELTVSCGWATYASIIGITPNEDLDIQDILKKIEKIGQVIHQERDRVKYSMNSFVIATGGYIPSVADRAKEVGRRIGKVSVDFGNTACKVPLIVPYIEKMQKRGGQKKKVARC
jgi:3-methyladenine DNA glycosylase AlkD